MPIMITEALAEIKTIAKRIEKKQAYITANLARQEGAKDPLEKGGGSVAVLTQERQAVADLQTRIIALRCGIHLANDATSVTIGDDTRTISDWLTWRREVAPQVKTFLGGLSIGLKGLRDNAKRQGFSVVPASGPTSAPTDIIVNIDEAALAAEVEKLEFTLGTLDGQLSLKNATVPIVE